MDTTRIYIYLKSKGFHSIKTEASNVFGDYYDVLSNNIINLRFIKDKSIKSIDISKAACDNMWYDLSLVKCLLSKEMITNGALTFEQYNEFLEANVDTFNILFNDDNYIITQQQLEELKNKRAQQMFPWL